MNLSLWNQAKESMKIKPSSSPAIFKDFKPKRVLLLILLNAKIFLLCFEPAPRILKTRRVAPGMESLSASSGHVAWTVPPAWTARILRALARKARPVQACAGESLQAPAWGMSSLTASSWAFLPHGSMHPYTPERAGTRARLGVPGLCQCVVATPDRTRCLKHRRVPVPPQVVSPHGRPMWI